MNESLTHPLDLDLLLGALKRPSALIELSALAACLLVAWGVARLARGRARPEYSVWLGERIVDGVLFPMLALMLAYAARQVLHVYGVVLAVFVLAIPVLLSLALIRLAARVLTAAYPQRPWVHAAERTVSWLAWGAVVLWLTGALPLVLREMEDVQWSVGSARVTLRALVEGTFSTLVVLMLVLWVSSAIERRLLRGAVEDLSLRKIAATAVRALLLFFGLLAVLSAVGIDLTALSVFGGAIGVGLGFGLQKLASNYVSGFVILAERSLRIGDVVKVDGFEGRIIDIKSRCTVVRAVNGRESIVPNELLITQRVENYSTADPKVLLSTAVRVAYGTDVLALRPRVEEAVRHVLRVLAAPAPALLMAGFGPDGIELSVEFFIDDPLNGQSNVRSDVNLAVLKVLEDAQVQIALPQRVVHGGTLPAGSP